MINKSVAKRYAQALLQIALEKGQLDIFEKELSDLLDTISADQHLNHIWFSERISPDKKKNIIKELFSGKISEIVLNFLYVIIDKSREMFFRDIVFVFKQFADIANNVIDAEVSSAVQLADKDFNELQAKLSTMTGKNVRIKTEIDPSIVGGLVVKIGDKVYDGSVIKRLAVMKQTLKNIQFSKIGVRD